MTHQALGSETELLTQIASSCGSSSHLPSVSEILEAFLSEASSLLAGPVAMLPYPASPSLENLSAPKSQRFLRFAIAMPTADPRNRAISETRESNAALRFKSAMESR